jgi:hypothetical protein
MAPSKYLEERSAAAFFRRSRCNAAMSELGSKSVLQLCPLHDRFSTKKQTFAGTHRTAVSCQKSGASLLDHLVGKREEGRRQGQAKHSGGLGFSGATLRGGFHDPPVGVLPMGGVVMTIASLKSSQKATV